MGRITSNNLNEALKMFNLGYKFSIDDLQIAKQRLLNERKYPEDKIIDCYSLLYSYSSQLDKKGKDVDLFNVYKDQYIKLIKNKYTKYPEKYNNKDNLNKYLDNVKMVVEDSIIDLKDIDNYKDFHEAIDIFHDNYKREAKAFITEYFYEFLKKYKNEAEVDIVFAMHDTVNEVLNYNLNDLVLLAHKNIKNAVQRHFTKEKLKKEFAKHVKEIREEEFNNNYIFDYFMSDIEKAIESNYEKYMKKITDMKFKNEDSFESLFDLICQKYDDDLADDVVRLYKKIKEELKEKNDELYERGVFDESKHLFNETRLNKNIDPNEITNFYHLIDDEEKSNLHKQ